MKSYTIPPPVQCTYVSEAQAEAAIHAWTRAHGFNVSRRKLYTTNGQKTSILFARDRAGKPQNNHKLLADQRQRPMRGSKKMGCPMRVKITISGAAFTVVHTRDGSTIHNHAPSDDIRIHAAHRQRDVAAEMPLLQHTTSAFIQAQAIAGVATANVHAALLMASPDALVIPKDVSNARSLARRRLLSTQTAMEALLSLLAYHGFFYKYEVDPTTQQLNYLFWAHPRALQRYREWPDVLIVDCTYKTNKYGMPLFNMVAVTGLNSVLPVAQCFLPGEACVGVQDFE